MKPLIGVMGIIDDDKTLTLGFTYVDCIEKSGGVPVVFPYVSNDETMDEFVRLCDGFCFSGGKDVEPNRYGERVKDGCGIIHKHRDELEFKVFKKALSAQKPILGICRGAQVVNVALGGSLYQDIPTECPSRIAHRQTQAKTEPSHAINVVENTPLHALTGKLRIDGNSFHHQAIQNLGNGLAVMATADDGIIEAIYSLRERYIRAYQWHPERLYAFGEDNKKIFDDFIENCRVKK